MGPVNAYVGGPSRGPVLALVHGLGGTWQNWWSMIGPLAGRGYRIVAPDLPGFGRSPLPEAEMSMHLLAGAATGALDSLGVRRAAIVGNSMGGFVSARAVLADQDRWSALVLNSAAGMNARNASAATGRIVGAVGAAAALSAVPGARFAREVAERSALRWAAFAFLTGDPDSLDRQAVFHTLTAAGRAPGYVAALRAIVGDDVREEAAEIRVPTLVVSGDRDRLVPLRAARRWARTIPGAELQVMAGIGHIPSLERPAELAARILAFLDRAGVRAAGDQSQPATSVA